MVGRNRLLVAAFFFLRDLVPFRIIIVLVAMEVIIGLMPYVEMLVT